MRQWFVRVEENEEQFADSSFKNLSIRNSGCSILRWILLERLNLRKIQCALLRLFALLWNIFMPRKVWLLFSRHYIKPRGLIQ